MTRVRNVIVVPNASGIFAELSFTTEYVDSSHFLLTVTRLDRADGWPDDVVAECLHFDGDHRVGGSAANCKELTVTTEEPITAATPLSVWPLPTGYPDRFDFETTYLSPRQFKLRVTRSDSSGGWGQCLRVLYCYGDDAPRRLRIPLGGCTTRSKTLTVRVPFTLHADTSAQDIPSLLRHVGMRRGGFNACLAPGGDGWMQFERIWPDPAALLMRRVDSLVDLSIGDVATVVRARDGAGIEDPRFIGRDSRGMTVLAVTHAVFQPQHVQKMAIIWVDANGALADCWRIDHVEGMQSLRHWDKNWAPVSGADGNPGRFVRMIYQWDPLTVVELDLEQRVARRVSGSAAGEQPFDAAAPRGSTPLAEYADYYLALVHNGHYQHRLAVLDRELAVLAMSEYFSFDESRPAGVEFCCSMIFDRRRLWFIWSERQNCVRYSYLEIPALNGLLGRLLGVPFDTTPDRPQPFAGWEMEAAGNGFTLSSMATGRRLECDAGTAWVFGLCNGARTTDEIAAAVAGELGQPLSETAPRVRATIADLRRCGALE